MKRFTLPLCLALSAPAMASATPAICAATAPPADASPAAPIARRYLSVLGQVLRSHPALGRADSTERYCVTPSAIFYDGDWLPPDALSGPPERSAGFAALAYLVGVHGATFSDIGGDHPPTADHAGAWFAGCALARVGARGDGYGLLVADLEQRTGPRTDAAEWRATMQRGYGSCANQ